MAGLLSKGSMAFHWLIPCRKDTESFFFLSVSAIVTAYIKIIRGFLPGTMGLLRSSVVVMAALCLVRCCSVQSNTAFSTDTSTALGGVISTCSPQFPGANTEMVRCQFLVIQPESDKVQTLTQEDFQLRHIMCNFFLITFFLELWKKAHNIKFIILTLFKHMVQHC